MFSGAAKALTQIAECLRGVHAELDGLLDHPRAGFGISGLMREQAEQMPRSQIVLIRG